MNNLRPKYHITALSNWINDPNGVIKYKDKYHVFFQYHPYGLKWGPMHWGHVVSEDLLHWEHFPIALTPGDEFDKDGCFSGSAIIHEDKLYVIYTGFINNENPDQIKQQQCLAVSEDGVHFKKLGLIIGEDNLPKEYAPNDFRDPMVYKEDNKFVMLVAVRRIGSRGNILRYESKDLLHWTFISDILKEDSKGIMIECPDYIKDLDLLLYSEQYRLREGYKHLNIHTTLWNVGKFFDNKFITSNSGMIDYGFDFYAPQVILKENVLIGWMNMWDRNNPSEQYGFAGSLSIPRKIEVIDNELVQTPIHPQEVEYELNNTYKLSERVRCGFYKIEVEGLKSFSLIMRKGKKEQTTFSLKKNEWVFNRSKSGVPIVGKETDKDSHDGVRRMPLNKKNKHVIYVVLDEFSVELFVDGVSMTNVIYPSLDSDLLKLKVRSNFINIVKYR